jgi:hypothetical protein
MSGYLAASGQLDHRAELLLSWGIPVALVFGAMKLTATITPATHTPAEQSTH